MKFESHRISFDGGSLPITGFSLMRDGFYPPYAYISSSIGNTMLCYSLNFVQMPCLHESAIPLVKLLDPINVLQTHVNMACKQKPRNWE